MPLPQTSTGTWPPAEYADMAYKQAEWATWYAGETHRLAAFYSSNMAVGNTSSPWWRFWSRAADKTTVTQRAQIHVPLAGDLAAVSAGLLFGEQPIIRIGEAHEKAKNAGAEATEGRLIEIIEGGGVYHRLLEAAETAAAIGGVFIYPAWDQELIAHPIMAVAQADMALPDFKWGILTGVTFWRVVAQNGNIVWRHLERHERVTGGNAIILHGLYEGNGTQLGEKRALDANDKTRGLEDLVTLPFEELDVQYIPNMRPNRLWRSSSLGVSDYMGSETLLDALDETYASWMRDIRLAKARIVVPRDYLDGSNAFDLDHEVYTPMDMEPGSEGQTARSMLAHQFAIRYAEHLATALEFTEKIVSNAGYSPQTYGLHIEGQAESGTALRIRENKTLLTLRRKGQWWGAAVSKCLHHMLIIDRAVFSSGVEPFLPQVELSDSLANDPKEMADTIAVLVGAQAVSLETRVKMVHPDWDDAMIQAEIALIKEEEKASMPDLSALMPGQGDPDNADPNDDPAAQDGKMREAAPGESDESA